MAEKEKTKNSNCPTCSVLGRTQLQNNLKEINYPNIKKRSRPGHKASHQQKTLQDGKGTKFQYNMGNGYFTNDPNDAMQEFMRREFPQVPKYKRRPHDVMLVPECYNYGTTAKKVVTKEESRSSIEEAKKKVVSKHDGDLLGKVIEEALQNSIRDTLEGLKVKNCVMISGWQDLGSKTITSREFDFFIVSEELKTLFHIESKRTMSSTSIVSAQNQLNNGYELINSNIPFLKENGWHYLKAIYFEQDTIDCSTTICNFCKPFILDPNTNIEEWWKMFSSLSKSSTSNDDSSYINILHYLFHQMYQQGDAITPSEIISSTDSLFFWSNIQYSLLRDAPEIKRVVFNSPFGTGKTTLLKERARRLLKKVKKVIFIIFHDTNSQRESILYQTYKQEFQSFDASKVEFHRLPCSGSNVATDLKAIINDNLDSNFFFDEMLARNDGISTTTLKEISKMLTEDSFLWVACQSEHPVDKKNLEDFFSVPEMNHPLRYAANILKVAENIRDYEGGTCFPPQYVKPGEYFNIGQRTLFFAMRKKSNLLCSVEQLSYVLERQKIKTIIKIDFEKETTVHELKASSIKDRLMFADEPKTNIDEFRDPYNTDKILVLSSKDNSQIRGFDVPLLVHFTHAIGGDEVEAIHSRCKSHLVVVCNEEYANRVVPSNSRSDVAKVIKVYDELMTKSFENALMEKNEEYVYKILKDPRKPFPIDARNNASETALMIACKIGSIEIVQILLDNNSDLDAVDAFGWNPFHHAADAGNLKILQKLIVFESYNLKTKSSFRKKSNKSWTTSVKNFFFKGQTQQKNIFPLIASTNHGKKVIHVAAASGHTHIVRYLIQNKYFSPDVYTSENPKFTPMHLAIHNNQLETVKCLINNGADPNFLVLQDTKRHKHTNVFKGKEEKMPKCGWSPLLLASKLGHFDIIHLLVEKGGANVNIKTRNGYRPIHVACQSGHLDIVKYFIDKGKSNVNVTTHDGKTPLFVAAGAGYLDIVKFLVKRRSADANSKTSDGFTPIHIAAQHGHCEVVEFLIKEAKVNTKALTEDRWSAFHCAIKSGNVHLIRYLDDENANVNSKTSLGYTALHIAAENGYLDIVQFLIKKKVNVNIPTTTEGFSALHLGAKNGHFDVVKFLVINGGVDKRLQSKKGCMPSEIAHQHLHFEIFNFLTREDNIEEVKISSTQLKNSGSVQVTRKVNTVGKDSPCIQPQHHASTIDRLDSVKLSFNDAKENVNEKDDNCSTPLHLASQNGLFGTVKFLISNEQVNTNQKDDSGATPLHLAANNGHLKVVKLLVNEGKARIIEKDSKGYTTLCYAIKNGHLSVVKFLKNKTSRLTFEEGEDGWTHLHIAAERGFLEMVKFLVNEAKEPVNRREKTGLTPLHIASENGYLDIVKFLVLEGNAMLGLDTRKGASAIHFASINGHLDIIKFIAKWDGAQIHKRMKLDGWSPLHIASEKGFLHIVEYLVDEAAVDIDDEAKYGWTPLHVACKSGQLVIVKFLIKEKGANLNCRTSEGMTPLHVATENKHLDIVHFLLMETKVNVNEKNTDGLTSLHIATMKGDLNLIQFLVHTAKASLDEKTKLGQTPLYIASDCGYLEIVECLALADKSQVNQKSNDGWGPLHIASKNGHFGIVKYLVNHAEAKVSEEDETAITPMQIASQYKNFEILTFLLKHPNMDVVEKSKQGTNVLLHAAAGGNLDTIKFIVNEKLAEVNSVNIDGVSALHKASSQGHLDVVKYLITAADLTLKTSAGQTALHWAAKNGHSDIVKFFLNEWKLDTSERDADGNTLLHLACHKIHPDEQSWEPSHLYLVNYLVDEWMADILAENVDGKWPIDLASENNLEDVVEFLQRKFDKSFAWEKSTKFIY